MRVILLLLLLVGSVVSFKISEWDEVEFDDSRGTPAVPANTYIVDLDLPPMERWNEVLRHFNPDDIKNVIYTLANTYLPSKLLLPMLEEIGKNLDRYIPQPFADELRGVSKALNMKLGDIVIGNIIYDVSAFNFSRFEKACTSIVTVDKTNKLIHGRNLDYKVPTLLRPLTIQVDYRKNNKTLFMATSYAGYIGVITGVKHGAFSISGDQRNKGFLWENLLSALEESWPTFFLQRMVLEKATNYKSAMYHLIKIPTISPVYYIVGGMQPREGAIVVKNRWNVLNVTEMKDNWYVLETNYDPWTRPPASDDRRDAGITAMNKVGRANMDFEQLYKVLSVPLVFNSDTTYTTVMSAADPSVYRTMIRYDAPLSD